LSIEIKNFVEEVSLDKNYSTRAQKLEEEVESLKIQIQEWQYRARSYKQSETDIKDQFGDFDSLNSQIINLTQKVEKKRIKLSNLKNDFENKIKELEAKLKNPNKDQQNQTDSENQDPDKPTNSIDKINQEGKNP